jgi:hypothetical protein
MRLLPPEHNLKALADDYKQMQVMLFGAVPSFDEMMQNLEKLENQINTPRGGE